MSWLLWKGEQWETTDDEAELHVHLRAPDTGGKRFVWGWHLFHADPIHHEDRDPPRRFLSVEISDLGFNDDWRQFSGFELRPTAAWQEEHEHIGEYGSLFVPNVLVSGDYLQADWESEDGGFWEGDHFVLRLGKRDGYTFPCELDAWVIPRAQYRRTTPESAAELARLPVGEPNLRVLARTKITTASVNLARCGNDPVPLAREYLEEFTGLTDIPERSIEWWGPKLPGQKKEAKAPGWRCTVNFDFRDWSASPAKPNEAAAGEAKSPAVPA
jgi:hypothetical protein